MRTLAYTLFLGNSMAALLCGQAQSAADVTVTVPATSNPYLAGMPAGTEARVGDRMPEESPVLIEVSLSNATAVSFAAAGAVDHTPNCPPECYPPSGSFLTEHRGGAEHGIAGIRAPMNALVGVFLDDQRPDRSRAPRALDFNRIGRDFAFFAPRLKQVFFIGTGTSHKGAVCRFLVPKGATRLFLGVMDSFEWNNNTGSFSVAVTVERSDVSSNMFNVSSTISYAKFACLPNHSQCTPDQEIVETRGPGQYHIVLPAQLEWGASVPAAARASVTVSGAKGTVCLDAQSRSTSSCNGPQGSGKGPDPGLLAPDKGAGALVSKTAGGRAYFSVNDRSGSFQGHQGYFEFDVTVR